MGYKANSLVYILIEKFTASCESFLMNQLMYSKLSEIISQVVLLYCLNANKPKLKRNKLFPEFKVSLCREV